MFFRPTPSQRLGGALLLALVSLTPQQPAEAESVVRIAMTVSDVPDPTGQPDQGLEGMRFVGYNIYEPLVSWDLSRSDVAADIRPGLATEWHIDPNDHKRWIFALRQGVTFHDGCVWNADNAVWNIERLTSDKSPAFNLLYFARARSRTSEIVRAEKIDDTTIAILTKEVNSLFPYNLTYPLMISKCAVEKAGNDYKVFGAAPSGSGPYRFSRFLPHERLELVPNKDYWDQSRIPKHDRLVLIPMPEATTRAAALLAGQVDMIEAPSPDTIPRLKAAGMTVITNRYPHTWPYIFNFQRGPFKDVRVRQAANYAMNRDEMVEMLDGTAEPAYGIFIPSQKYYGHPVEYRFDPGKAAALLKEAGCLPCDVTLGMAPSGSGQMQPLPMNELVKAQLDAVGFRVRFEVMDWNVLLTTMTRGWEQAPQLDGINFSNGPHDPQSGFLRHITTANRAPAGANWGWYQNADVDRLAQQVLTSFDEAERTRLLIQMHETVVTDAVRLFIVSDLNPRALSPKLKGFVQAQSWFQDTTQISVVP